MMKRIYSVRTKVLAVIALLVATAASAQEVRVVTSGGFTEAYKQLAPQFERDTKIHVISAFRRIAGCDTRRHPESAETRRADRRDHPRRRRGSRRWSSRDRWTRATVSISCARSSRMAVRTGAPKPDISTVDAFEAHAAGRPRSVGVSDSASGVYLRTVLFPRLGIAEKTR